MNKEQLLEAINHRKADVEHYQVNIDNYTLMIEMLPIDWPEHLQNYKNVQPVELINILPFGDIQTVSDLQYKEKLQQLLLTERLEQRKSLFVLKALERRLAEQT